MMSYSGSRADLSALETLSKQLRDISLGNKSLAMLDSKANHLLIKQLERYDEREAIDELLSLKDIIAIVLLARMILFGDSIETNHQQGDSVSNTELIASSSASKRSSVNPTMCPLAVDPDDYNILIISRIAMEEILRLIAQRENNNDIDSVFTLIKDIFDHFIAESDVVTVGLELLCSIAPSLRSQKYALFHLIMKVIQYYSMTTGNDGRKEQFYQQASQPEEDSDRVEEVISSPLAQQSANDESFPLSSPSKRKQNIQESIRKSLITVSPRKRESVINSTIDQQEHVLVSQEVDAIEDEEGKKPWRGTRGKLGAKSKLSIIESKANNTKMPAPSATRNAKDSRQSQFINSSSSSTRQTMTTLQRNDDVQTDNLISNTVDNPSDGSMVASNQSTDATFDDESLTATYKQQSKAVILSLSLAALLRIISNNQRHKEILVQMKIPDELATIAAASYHNQPKAMEYFVMIIDSIFTWDGKSNLHGDDSWDDDYLMGVVQVSISLHYTMIRLDGDMMTIQGRVDLIKALRTRSRSPGDVNEIQSSRKSSDSQLVNHHHHDFTSTKLSKDNILVPSQQIIMAFAMINYMENISLVEKETCLRWLCRWNSHSPEFLQLIARARDQR
jgi:hypothetical protein